PEVSAAPLAGTGRPSRRLFARRSPPEPLPAELAEPKPPPPQGTTSPSDEEPPSHPAGARPDEREE
ncbi:MAG: hypothetical protein M3P53_11935, partial [Actinomycetota bacterium]|nr:hypothetical protein [Actinomycetota bacterium]